MRFSARFFSLVRSSSLKRAILLGGRAAASRPLDRLRFDPPVAMDLRNRSGEEL